MLRDELLSPVDVVGRAGEGGVGHGIVSAATAVLPPFTATLALELAPVRVNLIAAGFVDTPLSASLLGEGLEARREELRTKLPIGRVVGPADVAVIRIEGVRPPISTTVWPSSS
jgi:NAD(P)-dependent dehydrogenase (short-subunit alcohol dehydrogenase family)